MNLKREGILGAGTMGNGIAQTPAVSGLKVIMFDVTDAALSKGAATNAEAVLDDWWRGKFGGPATHSMTETIDKRQTTVSPQMSLGSRERS